jgi:hypothetical protein
MPKANLKLHVAFDFEIAAPESLLADDHATLCRKLGELLGPLVLQGMPTITGKQLAKAGANIISHHHHIDAESLVAPSIDRAKLIAAAPHLTDTELDHIARQAGSKAPSGSEELQRYLRRQALALINDYRLVPCKIEGRLKSSGKEITVSATLNLTNGSVMIDEADRPHHLQQGAGAVTLIAADGSVRLSGNCAGHTLSGPVVDVSIPDIAGARDALIKLWQDNN